MFICFAGEKVFRVEATDADFDFNARLEYVIVNCDVTKECPFVIDQTGDVTLKSKLDRTTKEEYRITIKVCNSVYINCAYFELPFNGKYKISLDIYDKVRIMAIKVFKTNFISL